MTSSPVWQTRLFVLAAAVAVLAASLFEPDLMTQTLLLAPFVAVFGLPHGALDLPIAEALWPLRGWRGKALFASLYLGLSGLVVLVWVVLPGPSLFAFLIYSAVHFSGDWSHSPAALRWSGGIATIAAPALFHSADVARIFGYLAPQPVADLATSCLVVAGGTAVVTFAALIILRPVLRTGAAAEQAALWIAAALLAPLVYFIVYFCALHSVRHTAETINCLKDRKRALLTAGLLSAVTALAALASFLLRDGLQAGSAVASISQTIFIGLAALTIPHMALVDRFQRSRRPLTAVSGSEG